MIAKNAPIGVVSVVMKKGLSRLFFWDIETNAIMPGQFLKGDATLQDISDDGRYFSYIAFNYYRPAYCSQGEVHKRPQRYACIARPPYFTALAFFPTDAESMTGINFSSEHTIVVQAAGSPTIDDFICPDCPLTINRDSALTSLTSYEAYDFVHERSLIGIGKKIVVRDGGGDEAVILEFSFEYFEGIPTPVWAQRW
ncbi:MAG: hypothetical protein GC165_08670 [Armatimonadetes bacterium]|nr:hypothetical protein [Armatimonadota bacterium]